MRDNLSRRSLVDYLVDNLAQPSTFDLPHALDDLSQSSTSFHISYTRCSRRPYPMFVLPITSNSALWEVLSFSSALLPSVAEFDSRRRGKRVTEGSSAARSVFREAVRSFLPPAAPAGGSEGGKPATRPWLKRSPWGDYVRASRATGAPGTRKCPFVDYHRGVRRPA